MLLLWLLLLSFAFDCVCCWVLFLLLSDAVELSFIDSSGTHINNKLRLSFPRRSTDNLLDHNYLSVSCHHLLNFGLSALASNPNRILFHLVSCVHLVSFRVCVLLPQQAERLSAVVSHFINISPLLHLPLHFDYASLSLSLCLFISLTQFRSFFLLFYFLFSLNDVENF